MNRSRRTGSRVSIKIDGAKTLFRGEEDKITGTEKDPKMILGTRFSWTKGFAKRTFFFGCTRGDSHRALVPLRQNLNPLFLLLLLPEKFFSLPMCSTIVPEMEINIKRFPNKTP